MHGPKFLLVRMTFHKFPCQKIFTIVKCKSNVHVCKLFHITDVPFTCLIAHVLLQIPLFNPIKLSLLRLFLFSPLSYVYE